MRGVFDEEELKPAKTGRDTELTLGSGTLLAIFFGLMLICGLCFGLGYSAGRRAAPAIVASAPQSTPDQEPLQATGSIPKPSAADQTPIVPPQTADATAAPGVASTTGPNPAQNLAQNQNPAQNQSAAAPNLPAPVIAAGSPAQTEVHPAFAAESNQTAQTASAENVHPAVQAALPPSAQLMVQIAAVSNPEDASVLVNALRNRGYQVTVRKNLTDNLIHVRIGPFATRELADQWRLKLLNDGYNAIIQP